MNRFGDRIIIIGKNCDQFLPTLQIYRRIKKWLVIRENGQTAFGDYW